MAGVDGVGSFSQFCWEGALELPWLQPQSPGAKVQVTAVLAGHLLVNLEDVNGNTSV